MKLNKKLLTAALAGALVVTAVPAGTFAEKTTVNTNPNHYLTAEQAAAKVKKLSEEINDLSARRKSIVAQAYKIGETAEGTIEVLQRKEMKAKAEYEAAKAAFEGAKKAWEAAKDNEEKARLAEIAAKDALAAKKGDYAKLLQAAKDARKAAEEAADRQYDTTIAGLQRKFETAQTVADEAKIEYNKAVQAYDTAVSEKQNEEQLTRLRKEKESKKDKLDKANNALEAASSERADVSKSAKETRDKAYEVAANNYTAEKQRLDYLYKLNGNYGDKVAELTKLERARINATNAYEDAKAATKAAHEAYISARDNYDAKSKAYAEANQKTYKVTEELKSIEKQLKEKFVAIKEILNDQNKNINSLADKLNADMIKELEDFSKLSSSEQYAKIAELQKELAKLKKEYAKTSEGIQQVKKLVTYQFHVKDTEGKGVQGLTLRLANVDDTSKVYTATSDANGLIQFKSMVEGKYTVTVTKVPTGYDVYQDGKKIDAVKALFRAESEVKAENNVEKTEAKKEETKGNKRVDIPSVIDTTTDNKEESSDKKEEEKVIDKGTIVVEKKKKDNKDNKKPEKKETKKPAMPAKQMKKKLPKAGAAAEAATIAAAAMATMGGAYLSLKKRK